MWTRYEDLSVREKLRGIAVISIANPIYTIIAASGTGIGVVGSVIASIKTGESDTHGAQYAVGTASVLLIAPGLVPVLRNRGFVKYCMANSIASCSLNASLDWVFAIQLGYGTAGAAAITSTHLLLSQWRMCSMDLLML